MKFKILLVDDDPILPLVLQEMFKERNYDVKIANNVKNAMKSLEIFSPDYCLLDLKMPGDSGLKLIPILKKQNNNIKIVVLTGHASIETAVEAIKLGAIYYLEKPALADDILAAFEQDNSLNNQTRDLFIHEKEHIHSVLQENDFNISKSADQLGIHRRTLQRKIQKFGFIVTKK